MAPRKRADFPMVGASVAGQLPKGATPIDALEQLSRSPQLRQMSKPLPGRGMNMENGVNGPEQDVENAPAPTPRTAPAMRGPSM